MFHCSTIKCSALSASLLHCSAIRYFTVTPSLFHCLPIRWSTVPPSLLHCSTIRCSTVPPSDVPPFHQDYSTDISSEVLLFPYVFTTIPPWDFHHQKFYCSTIRCSNVSPSLFHSSTIRRSTDPAQEVLLFHHSMFYCFTISLPLFYHLSSTVPQWDDLLFRRLCSPVPR